MLELKSSITHLCRGVKKRMPAAPRGKTETERAIDCIARVLEDCERLKRNMSKAVTSSPAAKRRDRQPTKAAGRIGKK
jgi:hypothetical protein